MALFLDMIHTPAVPDNAAAVELGSITVAAAHVVTVEAVGGERLRKLLAEYGYLPAAIDERLELLGERGTDTLLELSGDRLLLVSHDVRQVTAAIAREGVVVGVDD